MTNRKDESSWPNARLSWVALLVSLGGGFNFGYQLLITNSSQEAFQRFVAESHRSIHKSSVVYNESRITALWGIILAIFFWGATIGSFFIQVVSERMGRKNGLVFSFALQIFAVVMTLAGWWSTNYIVYAASRFVMGAAVSVSIGVAPIFITECSPSACRGIISLATAIMMQLALVVGAIVSMPQVWGTEKDWWLMYALELAILLPVMIATFFIKESPTFLAAHGKTDESKSSFEFYHGIQSEEATELVDQTASTVDANQESVGLIGIFSDRAALRGMLVGCVVMTGMIMSGIIAINAFAYNFLLGVGLSPLEASIGNIAICAMTVFGVILSSLFIERYGRRNLLLVTLCLLAVFNVIIFACMMSFQHYKSTWLGWCVVLSICVFNLIFSAGPCPLSFFITGELVSQAARAAACTWVIVVLNALRSIVLVIYDPMEKWAGGPVTYFALFFPFCILCAALIYFYMPETKGKSPEEAAQEIPQLPRLCGRGQEVSSRSQVEA